MTGSYIPTAEEVTASPLDTLTTQEVRRSGSSEILNVLQKRNPGLVGGGNIGSTNANISSGNTLGGASRRFAGSRRSSSMKAVASRTLRLLP